MLLPSATKLRRLCFYRCLSVHRGGGVGIPAYLAGGIPACLAGFQAHTQGGSLGESDHGGGSPGPQPMGKLRGIWSRPTAKGKVEGDLARGVPAPPGGLLWGVPAPGRGGVEPALGGWGVETPSATSRRLLLRTVRILLECILVFLQYFKQSYNCVLLSINRNN